MTSGKTISLSEEKKRANKIGPKRIPATVRTALRCVLGIALLGALLAASAQTGAAQTYSVLYSFRGYDGATPGPVIRDASTGNLYGATMEGGTGCQSPGCGTIFKVTAPGVESVVHSFTGESADGAWPLDVLRDANGNLFAVTTWGGVNGGGDGVISEIDSSGVEKVLHRFE
ncbi:MAG: choice-of-anchor tandem repeat GloVer-containing protein, partial [Terriglobales bacterium]